MRPSTRSTPAGAPVVAADIPSGVDASTGVAEGAAVEAHATVTFHADKLGHWIAPGRGLRGELIVAPIGIPEGYPAEPGAGLIEDAVLELAPRREPGSTKFSSGEVLVVGGSPGLTGAVCMAAQAAIRAGAGYATVAVPAELGPIFEVKLTEVMSRAIGERREPRRGRRRRDRRGRRARGLRRAGPRPRPRGVLARARTGARAADRGAAGDRRRRPQRPRRVARLARASARRRPCSPRTRASSRGCSRRESAEVAARRLEHAREAARRSGAIVVLKGDDTIVCEAGEGGERLAVKGISSVGPRHGRHRRRAHRHDRGTAGARHGAVRRRLRRGPRARSRRPGGGPRARRRIGDRHRRDRGAPGRPRRSERRRGCSVSIRQPSRTPGGTEWRHAASSPVRVALPRFTGCVLAWPHSALASRTRGSSDDH